MHSAVKASLTVISALSIVACSGGTEAESDQPEAADAAEPSAMEAPSDVAASPETEAFEVCDGDGNRYPSEADAEAAGLEPAEYGATYCEYLE